MNYSTPSLTPRKSVLPPADIEADRLYSYYGKDEAISHCEWALMGCKKDNTIEFWHSVIKLLKK